MCILMDINIGNKPNSDKDGLNKQNILPIEEVVKLNQINLKSIL